MPRFGAATDAYADAVLSISDTEDQIAQLDREVLGTEGQMISRVTDLLRDLGDRRGRVLARDFARTLASDKWQSILLGLAGVLIGLGGSPVRGPPDGPTAQGDRDGDPRAGRRRKEYVHSGDRGAQRDR